MREGAREGDGGEAGGIAGQVEELEDSGDDGLARCEGVSEAEVDSAVDGGLQEIAREGSGVDVARSWSAGCIQECSGRRTDVSGRARSRVAP